MLLGYKRRIGREIEGTTERIRRPDFLGYKSGKDLGITVGFQCNHGPQKFELKHAAGARLPNLSDLERRTKIVPLTTRPSWSTEGEKIGMDKSNYNLILCTKIADRVEGNDHYCQKSPSVLFHHMSVQGILLWTNSDRKVPAMSWHISVHIWIGRIGSLSTTYTYTREDFPYFESQSSNASATDSFSCGQTCWFRAYIIRNDPIYKSTSSTLEGIFMQSTIRAIPWRVLGASLDEQCNQIWNLRCSCGFTCWNANPVRYLAVISPFPIVNESQECNRLTVLVVTDPKRFDKLWAFCVTFLSLFV